MRKSDRATRGKKTISYKEEEMEDVDSIISEEEESEEKRTAKRKKKKDDDSEDFDIKEEEELDKEEDEEEEEEEEDDEEDDFSEKKAKKKNTGKKRKAKEKLEVVVAQVEKKKRGRKKVDKENIVVNETVEKTTTTVKKTSKKFVLDPSFDLEKDYFYLNLSLEEESEIKLYIDQYFSKEDSVENQELKDFFIKFPNLRKNKSNVDLVFNQIKSNLTNKNDNISLQFIQRYNKLYNFFLEEYYTFKPVVLEAHFFPNPENEPKIVNLVRKAKISLFIAIFALTNDRIYGAIEEVFKRGVPVKIIADDEMAKCLGSDIYKAASLGIPVKTDNSVKFHMHHKFCVIDESIVITGSFNWTSQAVNFNQENILFYENKEIAQKYITEFNKLWNEFEVTITKEQGDKLIEEENKKRLEYQQKAKETRAKKKQEKQNLMNEVNKTSDSLTHI